MLSALLAFAALADSTTFIRVNQVGYLPDAPKVGPCIAAHCLEFTALRTAGRYRIIAGADSSPLIRIGATVYDGAADSSSP